MDREYFKGLVVLVNLKVVISALKVATIGWSFWVRANQSRITSNPKLSFTFI